MSSPGIAATSAGSLAEEVRDAVTSVVELADDVLEPVLVALLARGHVLIEGIPGTGKTLLARTLARVVGLDFHRIQFTNDLMPSDVVGSSVWRPGSEEFVFVKGPLFSHVVLADEINRTSPRTLSCLLEAMEEGFVSVEGRPVELAHPFFVLATRNPIEFHGTYPIPEAALDRFLMRVTIGYPDAAGEMRLYLGGRPESALDEIEPALDRDALLAHMDAASRVVVREPVAAYAYDVVGATRMHEAVALGVSPRAAMSWIRAARARAYLQGRAYALPDDLKRLAQPTLAHRIVLKGGGDSTSLLEQILESVPVRL